MEFKEEDAILKCLELNENVTLKQIKQDTGIQDTRLIMEVWNDYRNAEMGYVPDIVPGGEIEGRKIHYREYEPVDNEGSEID
jgi:hypothetical protein|tara:strand:+ start:141 stop:386 length:246 start_codon:yes stop_codon:yes gene_type:complete